jgi:hypothetical protein
MKSAFLVAAFCASCGAPLDDPSRLISDEAPITRLDLTLDSTALGALAEKPREWVSGALTHDGVTLERVAVRIKGHRSKQSIEKKPAFKLSFDKYVEKRRFFGLEALTLNNLVEDPTMMREVLAYRVHRAMGVTTPRVGYAELFVNGQYFGLYLMVEPVDDTFVERRGGDDDAIFEGEYGCDLYPGDVEGFDRDAGPKASRKKLLSLTRKTNFFDGSVDKEKVLTFLAASALIGDFDGYRQGHNYYLHHDARRDRWTLLPWGLDRAFVTPQSVFDSGGLLATRCFADAICREDYLRTVRAGLETMIALDLRKMIERLEPKLRRSAETDPKKPYTILEMREARRALERFIHFRPAQIRGELTCLDGDQDGDGHACSDCDDTDPSIHPGAPELCDTRDNNCTGLADDSVACDCPSVQSEGITFYACDLPMTWQEAADFCEGQGLALATIDSKVQAKALYAATQAARSARWWIGLNDRVEEGRFLWADNSAPSFKYYGKGEPDNYGCNQDCATIVDGGNGRWHDNHCGHRLPFVCRDRISSADAAP